MTTPTIELLAVPAWNCPPRSLQEWQAALADCGQTTAIEKDQGEIWLRVSPLGVRGYVCLEGDHVEAINFAIPPTDLGPATLALDAAALALGWEIHPDEPEQDDLDED